MSAAEAERLSRPHRLEFALKLVSPEQGAAVRYTAARRMLMDRFGIATSTAGADIARAYEAVAERVNATMATLPARIRDRLESLAHSCEAAATPQDRATASITLFRLGKLSGMDTSDETLAGKLSDAALNAAIDAEIAVRFERMSPDELDELARRKRGLLPSGEGEQS